MLATNQNELCVVTKTTPTLRNYQKQWLEQLLGEADIKRYEFYRRSLREAYDKNFAPG